MERITTKARDMNNKIELSAVDRYGNKITINVNSDEILDTIYDHMDLMVKFLGYNPSYGIKETVKQS